MYIMRDDENGRRKLVALFVHDTCDIEAHGFFVLNSIMWEKGCNEVCQTNLKIQELDRGLESLVFNVRS